MTRLIRLVFVAALASSCASTGALQTTTQTAHVVVLSVHTLVDAEAKAFAAGVYDNDHHQFYVQTLLRFAQGEKVLNDALRTWKNTQGAPMPVVVAEAIYSLGVIRADLADINVANPVAPFLDAVNAAIRALQGDQ